MAPETPHRSRPGLYTYAELKQNLDREDLDVTADTVLVLRNAGPLGGPRMPEWGMLLVLVKTGDLIALDVAQRLGRRRL